MLPEGWTKTTLENVGTVRRGAGSQYITYVDDFKKGIRLIRIGDFLSDEPVYIEKTKDIARFILSKNDILIAGTGATAGIIFEVPDEFVGLAFSYNAPLIQISDETSKKYIYYYLKSDIIKQQQEALFTGNAQPFLDTRAISGFKINLPPIAEQRRIAEILSTWDLAIAVQEQLVANARAQKKALMQQLLTGKKRLPGFKGEWKKARLDEVAYIIVSNVDKKSDADEAPVRLCNYMDVYRADRIEADMPFMRATAAPGQIKKFALKVGDVLITKDSETPDDIAIPSYVASTAPDLVCGYHLAIIRPKKETDGQFLKFYFEHPHTRYFFGSRANGATRFGLTVDSIESAPITLPSLAEQKRIGETIAVVELKILRLLPMVQTLKREKSALMQQLLTGKRRVKVEAIER